MQRRPGVGRLRRRCTRWGRFAIALFALGLGAACGIKGPPQPPLPRAPEPPRGVDLRQAGSRLEVSWAEPEQRQNGRAIEERLTYEVRALVVERPPAPTAVAPATTSPPSSSPQPSSSAPPPSSAPPQSSPQPPPTEAAREGPPGQSAPQGPGSGATGPPLAATPAAPVPTPAGSGRRLFGGDEEQRRHRDEDAFLKESFVVATVEGRDRAPGGQQPQPHGRLSVAVGPDRFKGTRLSSARVEVGVLALDSRGRRSPPRPILSIDPIEPLPPLASFNAEQSVEGVRLRWTIPPLPAGAPPVRVNVYRRTLATPAPSAPAAPSSPSAIAPPESTESSSATASKAQPRAGADRASEMRLLRGSPFAGEEALDDSVRIGERYEYEGRLAAAGSGAGLREGPPSPRVEVDHADRFPPSPPGLVTADALAPEGAAASWTVRLAWSPPVDADVASYRIHRAVGEGGFEVAATVPATEMQWLDSTVAPGRRYRYFVTAIDGASPPNESAPSETVDAITGGEEPAG